MRKTILLFSALLVLSCSKSDDDNSSTEQNVQLHPPSWIHGTWLLRNLDGSMSQSGFRFTSDDVCVMSFGMSACNKAQLEQFPDNSEVKERITDDEYQVKITVGGNTTEYEFEAYQGKIMLANNPSHPIYEKQ
jgi:hypothetical protein